MEKLGITLPDIENKTLDPKISSIRYPAINRILAMPGVRALSLLLQFSHSRDSGVLSRHPFLVLSAYVNLLWGRGLIAAARVDPALRANQLDRTYI